MSKKSGSSDPVCLSPQDACELLEISRATLHNWVRQGHLSFESGRGSGFLKEDILTVKRRIAAGEWDRLCRRANRKGDQAAFVAAAYDGDTRLVRAAEIIARRVRQKGLDPERTIFVLVLKMLNMRREVRLSGNGSFFEADRMSGWKRAPVKREVMNWLAAFKPDPAAGRVQAYRALFDALPETPHPDPVGFVYQSLLRTGSKSRDGVYYSPSLVLRGVFDEVDQPIRRFLDPCCGTGPFLLAAAASGRVLPAGICGIDRDPVAVRIARINLLIRLRPEETVADFNPGIVCADALAAAGLNCWPGPAAAGEGRFDMIATNPPWGASISNDVRGRMSALYPWLTSGESFSFFLARGLAGVKAGGRLAFILPEAVLNIRAHADIRRHLLRVATIRKIVFFGRVFNRVFSPVIRMEILNRPPTADDRVTIVHQDGRTHRVRQDRFSGTGHSIINAGSQSREEAIIRHVYSRPHLTLAGRAQWALGIVTGDNHRFLSKTPRAGWEAIYRGREVNKFRLAPPGTYIQFQPERFQQTAPPEKYRAGEKLVYRFISRKLVFAYDDQGVLTLNSANIMIPEIEACPTKVVLGLLNSSVCQFVFMKLFNTHKVLRGDLEHLPLPLLPEEAKSALAGLVERAMAGEAVQERIDRLVMEQLALSRRQINIIKETTD